MEVIEKSKDEVAGTMNYIAEWLNIVAKTSNFVQEYMELWEKLIDEVAETMNYTA
jgi:hypothetical protein